MLALGVRLGLGDEVKPELNHKAMKEIDKHREQKEDRPNKRHLL